MPKLRVEVQKGHPFCALQKMQFVSFEPMMLHQVRPNSERSQPRNAIHSSAPTLSGVVDADTSGAFLPSLRSRFAANSAIRPRASCCANPVRENCANEPCRL